MKCLRDKSVLLIDDDASLLCALDKVLSGAGATAARPDAHMDQRAF
jgi:hypothetical protein